MQRTVGLVGLGVIGRVHLAVLEADPRVTLSFVADPRVVDSSDLASARPQPLPVYTDLAASLRAARRGDLPEPDFIVLATPTSTHLDLASHVLVETASTVLSEKPLTGNSQTLREFETCHADASERVHVVNHFAFSPEVEWAARFVAERAWFTPSMVLSTFNDPYVKKSEVERATYVSSWIDSGPNQIGLLARFVSGGEIRLHTSTSDGMRSITEMAYVGGSAVLSSNWHTGDSSKQTSLRWANGREILLDHTRR